MTVGKTGPETCLLSDQQRHAGTTGMDVLTASPGHAHTHTQIHTEKDKRKDYAFRVIVKSYTRAPPSGQ